MLKAKYIQIKAGIIDVPGMRLILSTVKGLGEHDASHMAAGVAYFALLSLFPLLLAIISIAGLFLSSETLQADLFDFFEENLPTSVDELGAITLITLYDYVGPLGSSALSGCSGQVALCLARSAGR